MDSILDENIEIKLNHELSSSTNQNESKTTHFTIDELKAQGYKYIFICIGNEISKTLPIDGIDNPNVLHANDFLRDYKNHTEYKDKKFAIIGGGNVAIDSARVAKRLSQDSTIIYRKLEENMPANKSEVKKAHEEGINFLFKKNVVKIENQNTDEANTKLLLTLDDETTFETDYLITAIGATINNKLLDANITINENGLIKVDEKNETSVKNIFAGGDNIQNKSTVAWAIKNGRDVANEIAKRINKND